MKQFTDAQSICQAIMFGGLSNDELNNVTEALKYARAQLTKQVRRTVRAGDQVQFTSNRNGVTYNGTVEKVKMKYVLVATAQGRYNVPANMLEVA